SQGSRHRSCVRPGWRDLVRPRQSIGEGFKPGDRAGLGKTRQRICTITGGKKLSLVVVKPSSEDFRLSQLANSLGIEEDPLLECLKVVSIGVDIDEAAWCICL